MQHINISLNNILKIQWWTYFLNIYLLAFWPNVYALELVGGVIITEFSPSIWTQGSCTVSGGPRIRQYTSTLLFLGEVLMGAFCWPVVVFCELSFVLLKLKINSQFHKLPPDYTFSSFSKQVLYIFKSGGNLRNWAFVLLWFMPHCRLSLHWHRKKEWKFCPVESF